jgi:hypothetical protein
MSLFKQRVMEGKSSPSQATVWFKFIRLRTYSVHKGRAIILNIAAKVRRLFYIDELIVRLGQIELSPGCFLIHNLRLINNQFINQQDSELAMNSRFHALN